jgi:hypothetical protein
MSSTSPQDKLSRLLNGYWQTQAIYVAAKLGIADLLQDGPQTPDDLARATGSHPPSLYRLLRALASLGVFAEDDSGRFGLTPMAECLRTGVPGSKRATAVMLGEEHYATWGALLTGVQTGENAFEKDFGMPFFEFLAQNPDKGQVFDEAMTSVHGRETEPMIDAYDFSAIKTLADVGGGNGSLLSAVLNRNPDLQGMLFDLPGVIERSRERIDAAGLTDRCRLLAGSFFEEVPAGADAYMLRHIIHDWDDEKATRILQNIVAVLPENGRVLVLDSVIPPGNEPFAGKHMDLTMMLIPGGQERTEVEFRQLFSAAGLTLEKIVPTATEVSVIVGRAQ